MLIWRSSDAGVMVCPRDGDSVRCSIVLYPGLPALRMIYAPQATISPAQGWGLTMARGLQPVNRAREQLVMVSFLRLADIQVSKRAEYNDLQFNHVVS